MKLNNLRKKTLIMFGVALLSVAATINSLAQSTTSGTGGAATQGRENRVNPASERLAQPMMQMVRQMKAVKKTGDPDVDYAALTQIHHQAEIDLAEQGTRTAKNQQIVSLARELVSKSQKDVAELKQLNKELSPGTGNQAFSQEMNQKMTAVDMDSQKEMNGRLTGDFDKDFLSTMIQHHQNGIDMSQTYLKYGTNQTLKAHAERMVANNQQQIDVMKQMLK